MSEVINGVPRELLIELLHNSDNLLADANSGNRYAGSVAPDQESAPCVEKLRALLSEQPQASAWSCVCGEPELPGIHRNDAPCDSNLPQVSADDSRKLSDLGNELHNLSCEISHSNEEWAEQIGSIAGELWRWPQASAAQSAPAGEREALVDREWYWVRYEMAFGDSVEAPAMYRANCDSWYSFDFSGVPTRQVEVLGSCSRAWQRTQSAGVPEVTRELAALAWQRAYDEGDDSGVDFSLRVARHVSQLLAAAPAQPAAQREWPDDEIVAAWKWCEENGGTPAEFLSHSLLVKRSRVLGRPLTWREAIELTAMTTNMPDEQRDKLLAIDDEPDATAHDQGEVQSDDTARLDFMLQRCRKVVVERLQHDNLSIYVEEGFMGDKRYPGVRYSGKLADGEPESLEIKREAIDAALAASTGQEV